MAMLWLIYEGILQGYAVFGKVTAGMDIIQQIEKVKTTTVAGHEDVPREPIVIEKVTINIQS